MAKEDNFVNDKLITQEGSTKKSSEELSEISENAQKQHEMELQALFDQLELEEGEEVQFPYLVRGAELYCNCGTHEKKIESADLSWSIYKWATYDARRRL